MKLGAFLILDTRRRLDDLELKDFDLEQDLIWNLTLGSKNLHNSSFNQKQSLKT